MLALSLRFNASSKSQDIISRGIHVDLGSLARAAANAKLEKRSFQIAADFGSLQREDYNLPREDYRNFVVESESLNIIFLFIVIPCLFAYYDSVIKIPHVIFGAVVWCICFFA